MMLDILATIILGVAIFFFEKKTTNKKFALRRSIILMLFYAGLLILKSILVSMVGPFGLLVYLAIMIWFWFKVAIKLTIKIETYLTAKKIWVAFPIKIK